MDKQEYRELLDKIKYEYEAGNYKKVISVANEIDIRKIREPRILEVIASSYEKLGQVENARNALLGAYDLGNIKKNVVYKLAELSVAIGDLDRAAEFYNEFREVAPKDSTQYLLKYKIGKAGRVPVDWLINTLETYNNIEDDERWKYELACLYHEAGDVEKCVAACDDIFLWFGDGEYVKKALELKNSHTALTNVQQRKYEEMMQEFLKPEEMSPEIPLYDAEDDSIAEEFANEFLGEKTPKIEKAMRQESINLNGGSIEEPVPPIIITDEVAGKPEEYYEDEAETDAEKEEYFEEPEEDRFIVTSRETRKDYKESQEMDSGDTCVLSLEAIRKELDAECGEVQEETDENNEESYEEPFEEKYEEYEEEFAAKPLVAPVPVKKPVEKEELEPEPFDEEEDLGITTRITLDELRAMLRKDNINLDDEEDAEYDSTGIDAGWDEEVVEPEPVVVTAAVVPAKEPVEKMTKEPVEELVEMPSEEAEPVAEPIIPVEGIAVSLLAKLGVSAICKSSLSSQVVTPELGKKTEGLKENINSMANENINVVDDADLSYLNLHKETAAVKDPVAEERLKQIQNEVDIDSKVVLPYSMDDPSFENIEIEEYKKKELQAESDADKAIEEFNRKASEEPEIDDADLTAIGDSIAAMIGNEALGSDDDYTEYDNYEEPVEEQPKKARRTKPHPGGYRLSKHHRDEMAEFLLIDGMEEQICAAVEQIVDDKRQGKRFGGNLVVTGDAKTGKTYLAIAVIKAIADEMESGDGKVAKVQAEALNGKSLSKVFSKIIGSDLVIENVGNLADRTIEDLIDILNSGRLENMVVLEGNQLAVDNIFTNYPELGRFYDARIDINELNILQWADLATDYARENGYELDDLAKLALHAKISELNLPTTRLGYADVLDIMDDAIERANKRNVGKLFGAFKRNPDAKKEIIESDFD